MKSVFNANAEREATVCLNANALRPVLFRWRDATVKVGAALFHVPVWNPIERVCSNFVDRATNPKNTPAKIVLLVIVRRRRLLLVALWSQMRGLVFSQGRTSRRVHSFYNTSGKSSKTTRSNNYVNPSAPKTYSTTSNYRTAKVSTRDYSAIKQGS